MAQDFLWEVMSIKMSLFFYYIKVKCDNCGYSNELKVKKGLRVEEFVKTRQCKCNNCGVKLEPMDYQTEWLK